MSEQLRPLFGSDVTGAKPRQKLFFAQWLGGPRGYSEAAWTNLKLSHDDKPITRALAQRWLGHFKRALEATAAADGDRRAIFWQVRPLAMALVNQPAQENVARCGAGARTVTRARELARRGDVAGLGAALAQAPDLLRPTFAAAIMQAAALAGRAEIVRLLLDNGAGPDHPFYLPVGVTGLAFERVIYVTPLCAARFKRRTAVELLLAQGADATRIGVGRWVLHRELAPLLASRGAAIDSSGSWIGATCTGNQRRKDDPDYVRALLRHGARATDRRGRTTLDWLEQAAPSVSRTAVLDLLAPG